MSKLYEADPVRTLFQDSPLPASYEAVLARILNDNFVQIRLQDLMRRYFAAIAIAHARENEAMALEKRITLALNPPAPILSLAETHRREQGERLNAPKPESFVPAKWSVRYSITAAQKAFYLHAVCEKCGQQIKAADPSAVFEHCGTVERAPEAAVNLFTRTQLKAMSDRELYASGILHELTSTVPEKVSWFVENVSGVTRIRAQVTGEFMGFSGKPEDAEKFLFHGQQCPKHVIEEYRRARTGGA